MKIYHERKLQIWILNYRNQLRQFRSIGILSAQRSRIGAISNRLENIIKVNDLTSENLQNAESKISDVDMARAMMELSRENILSDVLVSMKSQAINNSERILHLLK